MDWNELFLSNIKDPHVKAMLSMMYTTHRHEKIIETKLKPFGISHEQFSILKVLEAEPDKEFSLKDIQLRLINQTANTTRLVEKLKQKGYVLSVINEKNRRQLNITITKEGKKILSEADVPLEKFKENLYEAITEEETVELVRILTKIQMINNENV